MSARHETQTLSRKPVEVKTGRKWGRCLICSERLHSSDSFVTTSDGYCCNSCLKKLSCE